MRLACQRARQFWHQLHPEVSIHLHIEDVPQFVPGVGRSGGAYRVGDMHLVETGDFLRVYLDAVTGRALVEQPVIEVPESNPVSVGIAPGTNELRSGPGRPLSPDSGSLRRGEAI